MSLFIHNVHGPGLAESRGPHMSQSFYWDLNDSARPWSRNYVDTTGAMPNMLTAGIYGGIMHDLRAVAATGSQHGAKLAAATPTERPSDV